MSIQFTVCLPGRQFYTCAEPQDSRCGFFLWADDGSNAGSSGSGGGAPGIAGQGQQGGRGGTGFRCGRPFLLHVVMSRI